VTIEITERKTLYSGYLTIESLKVRLGNGAEIIREVESHGEAVTVLPYDPRRRCALTASLFRAPVFAASGRETLEEPCAGMIDAGEDAATAVRREAHEELGVVLTDLEFIGRVYSSPGVSTERVNLYLAPYTLAERTGAGGGAPGEEENITVNERSLASLAADLEAARIDNALLLHLVMALRLRHPELFSPSAA
jgi:nudix-type nucleoside diphosphatase (YffH/AdpP family)